VSAPPPDPLLAGRLERRVLAAVVAAVLLLMLLAFQWGLPNLVAWNGDEIAPDKPLRVVHDWLRGHHKYPYLHWWLNLALYLPWLAGVAAAGQLDLSCFPRVLPTCFAAPWRDMTVFLALSRALSVAMGVGFVLATRRLALALHGDRAAALVAALVAGSSPTLVFFCHTSNLEVPELFWFTASLIPALAVWRRGTLADYAAFGLLAGCAISTKDPILGAYVLPGLALLAVHVARVAQESGERGAGLARRALLDRRLLVLAGAVAGLYVAVQNVIFNFEGFTEHWRFWTEGGPVFRVMKTRGQGPWLFLWRFFLSLEGLLGIPVLLLCLAGGVWAWSAAPGTRVLALPFASYFVVSLAPAFAEPRVALPLLPFLAIWGGLVASRLLRARGALRPLAAALVALALAHEFALSLSLDLRMLRDARYEAEDWLAGQAPAGARVAALSSAKFLPRLGRMGYEVRWFDASEIQPGALEAAGSEWAVVTGGGHPFADRAYLDDLRAGRRGYDVAFVARGGRPPPRWLSTRYAPGAVSPPVWILRRAGAQPDPGTAKR
jgi:hypothetical protein